MTTLEPCLKLKPMTTTRKHLAHLGARDVVKNCPAFGERQPNDCGPIALAALSGMSYEDAVRILRNEGAYADEGTLNGKLIDVVKAICTDGQFQATRFKRCRTLRQYIKGYEYERQYWTGLVITFDPNDRGFHAIAVIRGIPVNACPADLKGETWVRMALRTAR